MFSMAEPGRLQALLEEGGFTEIEVEPIEVPTERAGVQRYLEETTDLSRPFAEVRERLSPEEWDAVVERVGQLAEPFGAADGSLLLPGRALVASASG
jgi:hypothetical protein